MKKKEKENRNELSRGNGDLSLRAACLSFRVRYGREYIGESEYKGEE